MNLRILKIGLLLSLCVTGCSSAPNERPTQTSGTSTAAESPGDSPASTDPKLNKGVGPIKSLTLEPINPSLAKEGDQLFQKNCTACHRIDKRRVGPPLSEVTARRSPEWIMNMMLNPNEMLEKDPIAKELLGEYATQMANMSLTEPQARAILEYLRTKEAPNAKD